MARRTRLDPDQIPLITPDSDWTAPPALPSLRGVTDIAVDTETKDEGLSGGRGPGWVYGAGYVCGVSVAWSEGAARRKIYVPIRHPDTENFDKARVSDWLRDVTRERRVTFFNAPYDCGWMHADLGVPLPGLIEDASCMAVMIDENRYSFGLDAMCKVHGLQGKDQRLLEEACVVYGSPAKDVKKNIWRLPARYVGPYAEDDAEQTMMLSETLMPRIVEDGVLEAYRLEMDLVPMVHEMRRRGIRMDIEFLERTRDELMQRSARVLHELSRRLGGRELTIEDLRQQKWLINTFSANGVEYGRDEKTENASFGKDWMRQGYVGRYEPGREGHWLPLMIAEAKQCEEAARKFVDGYLLEFTHRGRIHASINQFKGEEGGTRSHRFSYADPPLQQIPSRPEPVIRSWTLTEEIAAVIRCGFLPEDGCVWGALDYSQQEYRQIVHYASLLKCDKADEAVAKYVNDPTTDFHNLVVELTGLIRTRAKDVNFAKSYGAGLKKFAAMTGMSLEEADRVMRQYDTEMPFVKQLGSKCDKKAQQRGYIKLLDGARCHFDSWEASYLTNEERSRGFREHFPMAPCDLEEARRRASSEGHPWHGKRLKRAHTHKAMNRLIQGGAARQTKMAMRACWQEGIVPCLQMHDEMDFSFEISAKGRAQAENASKLMREVVKLRVPMIVDSEFGSSWGKAKSTWSDALALAKASH